MVVHKRRKFSRMRGTRTHKWGAKKRHRKSGNRGGFGMAGTGKRAGHKKPSILKEYGNTYFGKHGFYSIRKEKTRAVNLSFIEENFDSIANKEKDIYTVNLDKLGYDKLLGGGRLSKKAKIVCKSFSKSAEEKIKDAGGEAVRC
ncbi:MAG: uL15 family ribosomal protein [Nanoarchaeota archaeon]